MVPSWASRTRRIASSGCTPTSTSRRAVMVPARPRPPRQWSSTSKPVPDGLAGGLPGVLEVLFRCLFVALVHNFAISVHNCPVLADSRLPMSIFKRTQRKYVKKAYRVRSSGLAAHAGQLRRAPNSRDYRKLHLCVDEPVNSRSSFLRSTGQSIRLARSKPPRRPDGGGP